MNRFLPIIGSKDNGICLEGLVSEVASGFRLSRRGLALTRMIFAAVNIYDLLVAFGGADVFLSHDGLMTIRNLPQHQVLPNIFAYFAEYGVTFLRCLLCACMCLNAIWGLGVPGCRFFSPVVWYLRYALCARMRVLEGFHTCAFVWHAYLSFLPHDAYWGVGSQAYRCKTNEKNNSVKKKCEDDGINNVVTFCYVANLGVLYFTTACVKIGVVPSFISGEEMWYVMLNHHNARIHMNMLLLQFTPPVLLAVACRLVVVIEGMGPLLAVWKFRTGMVLLLMSLHCGISVFLDVGAFFSVMFAILIPLLPSEHLVVMDEMMDGFYACITPFRLRAGESCSRFWAGLKKICAVVFGLYSVHILLSAVVVNCEWLADHDVRAPLAEGKQVPYLSQKTWDMLFKSPVERFFPKSNRFVQSWKHGKYWGVYNYPHTYQLYNMYSTADRDSVWFAQIGVLNTSHAFPLRIGQHYIQKWAHENDHVGDYDGTTSMRNTSHLHHLLYEDARSKNCDFVTSAYMNYWTGIQHWNDQLLDAGAWICTRHQTHNLPDAPTLQGVFFVAMKQRLAEPGEMPGLIISLIFFCFAPFLFLGLKVI